MVFSINSSDITFDQSKVQWATKVMTPASVNFLWKQGSQLLWPTVRISFYRHLFNKWKFTKNVSQPRSSFDKSFFFSFFNCYIRSVGATVLHPGERVISRAMLPDSAPPPRYQARLTFQSVTKIKLLTQYLDCPFQKQFKTYSIC